MKFLDEAKITVKSGHGGAGSVSFRREKFIEFGGPNGGDGGKGGDVVAIAVDGLNTLIDFRYRQHFKAKRGGDGMGRDRNGANADTVFIKVPAGTQILAEDRETLIADLRTTGDSIVLAKGGAGGWGNTRFKSATNRAPRQFGSGLEGEEHNLWLRLKLLADAGLVGLPNAGKSTFLRSCSRANPKVADYPFTTLHPNLGVVAVDDKRFVLADIPGLIEGASDGAGIGTRFLGHIERCRILVHLVDGTAGDDVAEHYRIIRKELNAYGHGIEQKPELVVLNKIDAMGDEEIAQATAALEKESGVKVWPLSGFAGEGLWPLLRALTDRIDTNTHIKTAPEENNEPKGWNP